MTDIQLTFAPGTNLDMMVTYEMASRVWESYLGDDATVHIYVGISDSLPNKVAGGALPGIAAYQQYSTFRSKLEADATTADDITAVSNLKTGDTFNVALKGKNKVTLKGNSELKLTRANAKAIGMVGSLETMLDGVILMNDFLANSSVNWDYDAVNPSVGSKELDAMSVALHEIGHILGYVSGVDTPGWLAASAGLSPGHQKRYFESLAGELHIATALDMFRKSDMTAKDSAIDMSIGTNAYFAIDRRATNLANFAEGVNKSLGGDGYQASHWRNSSTPIGIMDPTIAKGERMTISELDLLALDVIGWDRQSAIIDLATLQLEAKSHLASQLGTNILWLDTNSTDAAESLTADRSYDVAEMIYESQVYESLWGGGSGSWASVEDVYNSLWGGGSGSWIEVIDDLSKLMWQTAAFSTVEEESSAAPVVPPNISSADSFTGTLTVSPEDILDQGADELLQGSPLQPEQEKTEFNLDVDFSKSVDPFASLGITNSADDTLLLESDFGLDFPGGVATWFEGASLGVDFSA